MDIITVSVIDNNKNIRPTTSNNYLQTKSGFYTTISCHFNKKKMVINVFLPKFLFWRINFKVGK